MIMIIVTLLIFRRVAPHTCTTLVSRNAQSANAW